MNIWLKRLLIGLLLVVWLVLLISPTLAVVLARNGQLQLGSSDGPHTRLFLLQEADNEGLGLERARPVPAPPGVAESVMCLRTSVRYWMWTEGAENLPADYCQCIDNATGSAIAERSPACPVP
jgi:hypothetical protein